MAARKRRVRKSALNVLKAMLEAENIRANSPTSGSSSVKKGQ